MDAWTARPDRTPRNTQIPILRAKPGRPLVGLITAHDLVGAYTHYWRGRTSICTAPTCEACDAHRAPRWYGFLAVVNPDSNNAAIFEITPSTLDSIETYITTYGTLRGATIRLTRANPKINARLICELKPGPNRGDQLPSAPNVQAQLCKMWEIESTVTDQTTGLRLATPGGNRITNGKPA